MTDVIECLHSTVAPSPVLAVVREHHGSGAAATCGCCNTTWMQGICWQMQRSDLAAYAGAMLAKGRSPRRR